MPHNDDIINESLPQLAEYIADVLGSTGVNKGAKLTEIFESYGEYLKANLVKAAGEPSQGSNIAVNDDENQNILQPKLEAMVSAMIRANPTLTKQEAAHYLLHSSHGRRLAEHLNSLTKKENPMPRIDELKIIAKADGGMDSILESIVSKGSTTYTEHELTEVGMEYCKKHRKEGETIVKAFARYVEETPEYRTALLQKGTA